MWKRGKQAESERRWTKFEAEALPHLDDLFHIALWLVRDQAEAEDLVQETYTQALQSFHRYEEGTHCRAWLVTIMYRALGKKRRHDARLPIVSDAEAGRIAQLASEQPMPQGITETEILQALERLPLQFQEVVLLADVEEMTYKEIARLLKIPMGTVMSRLSRGRKLLRTQLATYARTHRIVTLDASSDGHGRADAEFTVDAEHHCTEEEIR